MHWRLFSRRLRPDPSITFDTIWWKSEKRMAACLSRASLVIIIASSSSSPAPPHHLAPTSLYCTDDIGCARPWCSWWSSSRGNIGRWRSCNPHLTKYKNFCAMWTLHMRETASVLWRSGSHAVSCQLGLLSRLYPTRTAVTIRRSASYYRHTSPYLSLPCMPISKGHLWYLARANHIYLVTGGTSGYCNIDKLR